MSMVVTVTQVVYYWLDQTQLLIAVCLSACPYGYRVIALCCNSLVRWFCLCFLMWMYCALHCFCCMLMAWHIDTWRWNLAEVWCIICIHVESETVSLDLFLFRTHVYLYIDPVSNYWQKFFLFCLYVALLGNY